MRRDTHEPFASLRACPALASVVSMFTVTACLLGVLAGSAAPVAAAGDCGDADGSGTVAATDALAALRGAVGLPSPCDENCDCDLDCDRDLTAGDALDILRKAIQGVENNCCFLDGCFYDEDCEAGEYCGTDPDWSCDAACVPE